MLKVAEVEVVGRTIRNAIHSGTADLCGQLVLSGMLLNRMARRMRLSALGGLVCAVCCLLPVASPAEPYAWRGLVLDESRFFFGKQVVKDTLDRMAACGLNVFHWHLTDDQGWRLSIAGCPELTTVGAFRASSPKVHTDDEPDGKQYGPFFYTEADIREILAYASVRGIRVIPEIEMPGHVGALLTAHPEFSCRGTVSPDQMCNMHTHDGVLCVGGAECCCGSEGTRTGPILHQKTWPRAVIMA